MKKLLILFALYSNLLFSQTTDWKNLFLSKEKWYERPMIFDKEEFYIASEHSIAGQMMDHEVIDEHGLMISNNNEFFFKNNILKIVHTLGCGKRLSCWLIDYRIKNDILQLDKYELYHDEKATDLVLGKEHDYGFDYQLIKYENGLIFMKLIEK